jgi:hypothetical protein
MKESGMDDVLAPSTSSLLGDWTTTARMRDGYSNYRGWLYSAIHALASEAAAQPVCMGKFKGVEKKERPSGKKAYHQSKMTQSAQSKTADQEFDVVIDHPVLKMLERPNPIQTRWEFVYSFVTNLKLTGWSYVIANTDKDGNLELWSLPTTWVRPDHSKGPFSQFRIVNPQKPGSYLDAKPLTREQVGFAHLPNPSDPLSALSPVMSQLASIRIDDHIQTSQERFFENGIFPAVVVTMGKGPYNDTVGRPVLNGVQRRQVVAAIRKVMGGVANYGNPAIVDGLIEKIDRLSATQNEMGWDKSEDKVRTRILSAFGVHPYILGEAVSVGGYAQVAKIEERFCKRVNSDLDMLSCVVTNLVGSATQDEELLVWWEKTKPNDPGLEWQKRQFARTNGDISQNELRAELGLPPDEDNNEAVLNAGQVNSITQLLGQVGAGAIDNVQAKEILRGMGLPDDMAEKIAGPKREPPAPAPAPVVPGKPGEQVAKPSKPPTEQEMVGQATEELKKAIDLLKAPPETIADLVMPCVKFNPNHDDQGRFATGGGAGVATHDIKTLKSVADDLDNIPTEVDEITKELK